MSKVGAHLLIWTSRLSEDTIEIFHKIKEIGFDGVEIPLVNPMEIEFKLVEKMKKELEKINLECTCCGGLGKGENLIDEDQSIRERGKNYLKRFIDICSDFGSYTLCGVLYGTYEMSKGRGRTKEEWDLAVGSIRRIADYAKDKKITLCLEAINRYETYFLNTADDGVRLVKDIGKDNVKLHLDTYHMNIEEKNFYTSIVKSRGYLRYMHCSENDRGIPGTGHVNWNEVFKGLSEINYNGWLVIESFYGPMKEIPIASSVWRKLAEDPDEIAIQGLRFIRERKKQYEL